jgi:riboflavin biosynthesis pyrimidine reductase
MSGDDRRRLDAGTGSPITYGAAMRELWPDPAPDVDPMTRLAGDRRPRPADRPWVMVNMIATVDGGTATSGVSGGLGADGDRTVFRALRSLADVILVGAATVRAENYGPPRPSDAVRAQRRRRGQEPTPRMAVVSSRLDLDPDQSLFAEAEQRPLVFTGVAADPASATALAPVAELVRGTGAMLDLPMVLTELAERGAEVVLCEGGPSLNGQLVAAALVDEWCTTVSPRLVAGPSARAAHGHDDGPALGLRLDRVMADDEGFLFLRYLRT